MKQSRLNILINNLTKKEKRQFKTFLASPYFNKREDLSQLFQIFEKGKIDSKEAVFKKLYPKTAFSDAKLRLCMSLLFKQIEQFLLVNKYLDAENEPQRKSQLVDIFLEKDLQKHTTSAIKDAQLVLNKQPLRNAEFYDQKEQLLSYLFQKSEQQTTDKQLQEISAVLDTSFILKKLKQACIKITLESVYGVSVDIHFLEECLNYIHQNELLEVPAVAVYYHCYQFLSQPEKTEHFDTFNDLIFEHFHIFSPTELSDLVIASINFCVRQYNSGNRNFLEQHLKLYQFGFKNDIFIVKGELSRLTYQNSVTFGLILKAFDWVEDIIENYTNHLPKQYQKSTYSFNMARLRYEQNDKNQALDLLQNADSKDVLLSVSAKMLQLQIYYELEEIDLLQSHISAMGAYIRRKKILGYHRTIYRNSLKFAQKLIDLNPFDKKEKEQLKNDILETKLLAEKEWLLEQIKF